MPIQRTMEVLDVVGNEMNEWTFKRLMDNDREYTLQEVEWEIELISFSNGRPAVMTLPNGDPGYPEEPAEFETTMLPEEVAGMIAKMVVNLMDDDDCTPKNYALIWEAIYKAEQNWQDNNLDQEVYNMVRRD